MKHYSDPLVPVFKVAVFMMLLGIAGIIGAGIAYPDWPTPVQCRVHCAAAGTRVAGFHPRDGGRGMCVCGARPCQVGDR